MTQGIKKELTPEQIDQIGKYAYEGCQNGTIAALMDIPESTFQGLAKDNFVRCILRKKRAERKLWLREAQMRQIDKGPVMAIFLGKNELEQADKKDVAIGVDAGAKELMGWIAGREAK